MKHKVLLQLLTVALLIVPALRAEEGGTGHYIPGAAASFIDAFPGRTALAAVPQFTYYNGNASASREIPIIGGTALRLDATAFAATVPLIYQTPIELFGGHHAAGVAIPYVWIEASGRLSIPNTNLPLGFRRDTASGPGDVDIFGNNLLEVMQFVCNHTTFDPKNKIDQALLAAWKPLGIEPGKKYDPATVAPIDGKRFRDAAERLWKVEMARMQDPVESKRLGASMFQPKGKISLEVLVMQPVTGPIGLPAAEAMYKPVVTPDGKPMNAQHDYVIHMTKEQLPPAGAFWSATLYNMKNGFFVPNDRKKYSVGLNAGMKLNPEGGIDIYVAAKKPAGVPDENWLPITRKDEDMDMVVRVYVPDLEKMKTWQPPKAEKLSGQLAE